MKCVRGSLILVFCFMLFVPSQAFGAAFGVNENSTVSQGRMHATTARLDEPGTLFRNVAGLALLPGLQISIGAGLIHGNGNFTDTYDDTVGFEDTSITLTKVVPNLAITYNLGSVTLGVGLYAPYGMTIDWGEDFGGDPRCTLDQTLEPCAVEGIRDEYNDNEGLIKRAALAVPHVALGASMELADGLFLGLSAQMAPPGITKVEFWKYPTTQFLFPSKLTGDSMGFGGTLGLMYRPNDTVFIGLNYKSRMKLDFEGQADTVSKNEDTGEWDPLGETPITASITLPDEVHVGIGLQLGDWYVEADAGMILWSLFDELVIEEEPIKDLPLSVTELEWGNGFFYRLGAEWYGADDLVLRFGAALDVTPVPDHTISPMLPDSNRLMGSMGMSYAFTESHIVDLSYTYVQFLERKVDHEDNPIRGTYSTAAHIGSLNYRFSH